MSLKTRYRLLQTAFWMMFCVGQGFITYYLTSFDYTTGMIGTLTAAFGICAAFLQNRVARLADHAKRFNWRSLILIFSATTFLLMTVLTFVRQKTAVGLLYGTFLVCINIMLPLVNAGCFYLNQRIEAGIASTKETSPIDFGIARGLGSFSFSVLSFLLGRLTAAFGRISVTLAGIVVSVLIFLAAWCLKDDAEVAATKTAATQSAKEAEQNPSREGSFFRRYPVFLLMMAGLIPVLTFHNIINTYLLQIMERVGGGSAQMGTAFAIAGLCEVPTMFLFVRLKKRFQPDIFLVFCGVFYLVRVLLMIAATTVPMIYATELLQMVTFALYASAAVYYTEDMMQPEDRTTGQAFVGGVSTVGQVIGNLVGGWVLQYFGVTNLLWTGCALIVLGTVIITAAYRKGMKAAAAS